MLLIKLQVYFLRFSHILSVVAAFSVGCGLYESDFMPVSKPKVFYLWGGYINTLEKSLEDL